MCKLDVEQLIAALTTGTANRQNSDSLAAMRLCSALLSEGAIAPLQLLAETPENRKIAVLLAMKEL